VVGARKTAVVVLLFFLAGSLIHFALARLYVRHAYPPGLGSRLEDRQLTIATVTILGGISVAWFMFRLLRKSLRFEEARASRLILRGGLYGVLATTTALELFYLLVSAFLAVRTPTGYSPLLTFLFGLMDVQTYGMQPLILAAPVAFVYGTVGGATISLLVARHRSFQKRAAERRPTATRALVLGILGVFFFWVPILGMVPDALAIFYGMRVLKQVPRASSRDRARATVGIVLGTAALLYMGIGFVILFWPRN